jgi:hypothetical protein
MLEMNGPSRTPFGRPQPLQRSILEERFMFPGLPLRGFIAVRIDHASDEMPALAGNRKWSTVFSLISKEIAVDEQGML